MTPVSGSTYAATDVSKGARDDPAEERRVDHLARRDAREQHARGDERSGERGHRDPVRCWPMIRPKHMLRSAPTSGKRRISQTGVGTGSC